MTTEHQTAREAALSALKHSMDGILHAMGKGVHVVEHAKLPGAWTAVEVSIHMYKMIGAAWHGRWEDFGDHSLAASSALLNSAALGVPGLVEGLNDATVAVRRAAGERGAGITVEEAEHTGLHAIQTALSDRLFEALHPDAVPQRRVGTGEAEATPGDLRMMEKLSPETLDRIRSTLSEGNTPGIHFEPEVVTLPHKGHANATSAARGAPFSLEVRIFQPRQGTAANAGADHPFDVGKGVGSTVQAEVTINPATAGAGKVMIQVTPGTSAPSARLDAQRAADATIYTLDISSAGPMTAGMPGNDVVARLTISSAPGSITIRGTFESNPSPAHQMVLRDAAGRGVFLAGHMPSRDGTGPAPGATGVERPSSVVRMTVGVDASGRFNGRMSAELTSQRRDVDSRTAGGKEVSDRDQIAAWNHMVMKHLTPPGMPEPQRARERQQPAVDKALERSPQTPER